MNIRKLSRLFSQRTVCVVGEKGTGKDVLFGNVIQRRKLPYMSNTNYGGEFIPLDFEALMCGGNTYRDFLNHTIKKYIYPYPDKTDVYIADVGVYFPSQYCNELNRDYKEIPVFEALSRHFADCNLHFNVQNLNRAWDKLREQSGYYIRCNWLFKPLMKIGVALQKITIYDKYDSCVNRVKPFKLKPPATMNREQRRNFEMMRMIQIQNYENTHGLVRSYILIYRNKSKHNTRAFKEMLANGREV